MSSGEIHFTDLNNKPSDSGLYVDDGANADVNKNTKMINSIITVGIILTIAIYLKMSQPKY
jgi:hypothetical protein